MSVSKNDNKLKKLLGDKKFYIVAHRGSSTGNIIENTIASTKVALQLGADLIEMDVCKSTDGVFYAFHRTMELRLFGKKFNIEKMTSEEIDKLEYINTNLKPSGYCVERIENIFKEFDSSVFFNIDRTWSFFEEFIPIVKKHKMENNIILKFPFEKKYLDYFKQYPELMYMPIVRQIDQVETILQCKNKPVALEIIFEDSASALIQKDLLNKVQEADIMLWVNSIIVGPDNVIAENYTDDCSVLENPEMGWGKLLEMGFSLIQTDWPSLLKNYREQITLKNKLRKKI